MRCPICENDDTAVVRTARAMFFRCRNCSFVFLDPRLRPTPDESAARYSLHRNSADDSGYVSYLSSIIDRTIAAAGPGVRRVLDWGSGPVPVCSRLLTDRGFDVASWDPHFQSDHFPEKASFDAALCVEVAEHFFDPVADFTMLASLLRPGGFLAVHTHFVPAEDDAFRSWWYKEDVTHVSFYSADTLVRVARVAGLMPLSFEDGRLALFRRPLPVLVAGGANWDIEGRPFAPLVCGDSNPGSIRFSAGGTGRNIAEDLALLGMSAELVSAVGDDGLGREIIGKCVEAGIGTAGIDAVVGESTSSYISILDETGETALAVSGMNIYDSFGADAVRAAAGRSLASALGRSFVRRGSGGAQESPFSALVVDANLRPDAIEALLDLFPSVPSWFDPVSAAKARRFAEYRAGVLLRRFSGVKPNLGEALAMLGRTEAPGPDLQYLAAEAAAALRSKCREAITIYITLGGEGVFRSAEDGGYWFAPPETGIVSSTGAGDAFTASIIHSAVCGFMGTEETMRASAAAAIALRSLDAVPKALSGASLEAELDSWRRRGISV